MHPDGVILLLIASAMAAGTYLYWRRQTKLHGYGGMLNSVLDLLATSDPRSRRISRRRRRRRN